MFQSNRLTISRIAENVPASVPQPTQTQQTCHTVDGAAETRPAVVQSQRQRRAGLFEAEGHTSFSPYQSFTARGITNLDHDGVHSVAQAKRMADKLRHPNSSLDALISWLSNDGSCKQSPQELLLRIIHSDIIAQVEVVRVSLEDIGRQSINLSPLQKHALHWRSLLGRFQYELLQILRLLPAFVDFLYTYHGNTEIPTSSERLRDRTLAQAREASDQVERAYSSLCAELSIAEARRSIEEAESVAKLTEPAFLFIPLPFATSLFSMRIKELQSSAPVSYFIGTAIAIIGFAYVMRLAVRSSILKNTKNDALHSFGSMQIYPKKTRSQHSNL